MTHFFENKRTALSRKERGVILAARNSLRSFDNTVWARKDATDYFDITMG